MEKFNNRSLASSFCHFKCGCLHAWYGPSKRWDRWHNSISTGIEAKLFIMFEVKRDLSTFEFILTWKYVLFLKVLELSLNQTCLKQHMHAGITATYYCRVCHGNVRRNSFADKSFKRILSTASAGNLFPIGITRLDKLTSIPTCLEGSTVILQVQ